MALALDSRLKFHFLTLYYRLGKHGVLGLILLVLAIGLFVGISLPQKKQLSEIEALEKLGTVEKKQAGVINRQDDSSQLLNSMPSVKTTDEALESIVNIANEMSLSLDSGQYEMNYKERAGIVLFQVGFPLKGSYAQIKQFLATTLNSLPNAALTEVLMQRSSSSVTNVEADVVFVLYFKKAG